jgi:hypothetical protein
MSDDLPGTPPAVDPAAPPPAADPGRALGRNPAQLAADKADWVRYGGNPAAFDQAITGASSAVPTAAPAKTDTPISAGHTITPDAAKAMIAELRKHDPALTDDRLAQALRGNGYTPEEAKSLLETVVDPRNSDQKLLDRGGLGAPVSAAEYGPIVYPLEFSRSLAPGQLQAFDAEAKAALVAMEVPALAGPSLVQDLVEASQAYRAMTPDQRENYQATQDRQLTIALGSPEAAKTAVEAASATLRKAPTAFLEALNASGALRSASVVLQLANASNFADVRKAVAGSTTLASFARH